MSATSEPSSTTSFYRSLVESGKTAIIVPLIIGGAVIVGIILLWEAHNRKLRMAEMTRVEELVRIDLRNAFRELRALNPDASLAEAAKAREKLKTLCKGSKNEYSDLQVALLLIEGESLYMQDGKLNARAAEERFDFAIKQITRASGEMWLFGMIARARTRYELGMLREAKADLDHILERNSSYGAAYYWRSLTRAKLGDAQGAAEDERHARNLDAWPPLRDFMQPSGNWTRDLLCRPGECVDRSKQ